MVAATVLYEGEVGDTASIITALSTNAASTLIVFGTGNGTGVTIMLQGS